MAKLNNYVIWILGSRKIGCQDLFRVKSLQAAHRGLYYSWLQREAPLVTHCLVTTEPGPHLSSRVNHHRPHAAVKQSIRENPPHTAIVSRAAQIMVQCTLIGRSTIVLQFFCQFWFCDTKQIFSPALRTFEALCNRRDASTISLLLAGNDSLGCGL